MSNSIAEEISVILDQVGPIIETSFNEPLKNRTKAEINEAGRYTATFVAEEYKKLTLKYLQRYQRAQAQINTLEWYFNEKVEAHKQALLDKDKQIAELQQQLSEYKLNIK